MKKPDNLPNLPGVYLFKNSADVVIYIGKAKSLQHRVSTYFYSSRHNFKTDTLMQEAADLDHIITNSEHEALLLEAQLIKKHQPKFNVLFKDGQPFVYILVTQDDLPILKVVRNKKEKGTYFGPFLHKTQARRAVDFLIKTFRLKICNKKIPNGCLEYHLGLCPGTCKNDFDPSDYLFRLHLACAVIKKDSKQFIHAVEQKIKEYTTALAFEKARNTYEYLEQCESIFATMKTRYSSDKFETQEFATTTPSPYAHLNKEEIAVDLQKLLKLPTPIRVIDCFDISHFQSRSIVGSCVRFTNGMPDKNKFRRFKIKTLEEQNDYAALQEIVQRRYKSPDDWPDLIFIDGGKGQLSAVQKVAPDVPCASIAKQFETVYSSTIPNGIRLNIADDVGKLLIALRDYAHHFAISYHRLRRTRQQ